MELRSTFVWSFGQRTCGERAARAPPLEPAIWSAIHPEAIDPDQDAGWDFNQSLTAQEAQDLS
jgi:hypothetical protein